MCLQKRLHVFSFLSEVPVPSWCSQPVSRRGSEKMLPTSSFIGWSQDWIVRLELFLNLCWPNPCDLFVVDSYTLQKCRMRTMLNVLCKKLFARIEKSALHTDWLFAVQAIMSFAEFKRCDHHEIPQWASAKEILGNNGTHHAGIEGHVATQLRLRIIQVPCKVFNTLSILPIHVRRKHLQLPL